MPSDDYTDSLSALTDAVSAEAESAAAESPEPCCPEETMGLALRPGQAVTDLKTGAQGVILYGRRQIRPVRRA